MTLRRALQLLEGQGLIAMRQGRAPLVLAPGEMAGTKREQVIKRLGARIEDGAYGSGEPFPSELELMAEFSASRDTIRVALKELEASGHLVRRQGLRRQVAGTEDEPDLEYQRVARELREELNEGIYPPGSVLPGEDQLCGKYNVSRPTVRAALTLLQQTGEIERTVNGRRRVREVCS